jgi:hypothetical protein
MAAAVRVRKRVTQVNEASGKRIRTIRLVEDGEETGKSIWAQRTEFTNNFAIPCKQISACILNYFSLTKSC